MHCPPVFHSNPAVWSWGGQHCSAHMYVHACVLCYAPSLAETRCPALPRQLSLPSVPAVRVSCQNTNATHLLQLMLPPGYLADAYRVMRAAGALCVADEVQTGFGRLGDVMWAFERQGVVPDIVTLGKPMGAGGCLWQHTMCLCGRPGRMQQFIPDKTNKAACLSVVRPTPTPPRRIC